MIIEKYYTRLGDDFHNNKKVAEEVAVIPSKKLRNKIAGFATHLMKRIQKVFLINKDHISFITPSKGTSQRYFLEIARRGKRKKG